MVHATDRITSLDGIRGFAIFLVIINHIVINVSQQTGPAKYLANTLFLGGPFGVNVFFILCGFLMAFLYPRVPRAVPFIRKRYYRIFPLFITACTYSTILYIWPHMNVIVQLCALIAIAYVLNFFLTRSATKKMKGLIHGVFLGFVSLQVIMVGISFLVGRLTAPQFEALPTAVKVAVIYLSNVTLTLWAGWNIPILNGPFWSLAPEVLFYIAYPFFARHVSGRLPRITAVSAVVELCVLAAAVFSIDLLFGQILALSRLNIVRAYAFGVGILVARTYMDASAWTRLTRILRKTYINFAVLLIVPFFLFLYQFFPDSNQLNLNMLHTVANTSLFFVFAATLMDGTYMHSFFTNKILLFLGLISYPAYLIHAQVIDVLRPFLGGRPGELWLLVAGAYICTIPISYVLHVLLERPYFSMREILSDKVQ